MHVIKLNGYNATTENGEKLELGTFDSYGEEQLQIVEAPDWENLSVIATFNPPNKKPVQVVVDSVTGVIKVPKEATADLYGVGTIVFVGLADGVQRISADCEYIVRKHSNASGTEPAEPTPDLLQQVLTLSRDAQTAAKNAEQNAKNAAKDAADTVKPYREEAVQAATAASLSEKNAAESKAAAQEAAERATQAGIAASNAAEEAERSAGIATDAAGGSALNAENAQKSALNAQQSANNAAESQSVAAASADAAAKSQQSAAIDAKTASDAKVAAAGSAETAAGSANAAENSASAAARSEQAAGASEEQAAVSERAAKESADAAAKSAQAALESKTAAETSETNAAASAKKAQDVADSLPEDYTTAVNEIAALKINKVDKTELDTVKQQVKNITPDDSAIGEKPWSSKNIIDMFCPPLEENGNPVVCYPVAGYPLGVKAKWEPMQEGTGTPYPAGGGKQLLDTNKCVPTVGKPYGMTITLDGDVFKVSGVPNEEVTTTEPYSFAVCTCYQEELRGKGYKVTAWAIKGKVNNAWGLRTESESSLAIAAELTPGVNNDIQLRLMVSKDTPTAWEPYENIRPIKGRASVKVERCGENLLNIKPFNKFTKNGITYEYVPNAGIHVSGTATTTVDSTTFPIWHLPPGKYYGLDTGEGIPASIVVQRNGKNLWLNAKGAFEILTGDVTKYWYAIVSAGSTVDRTVYPYIVPGTNAPTTYTPYTGQTNTLTLPETVYGGDVDAVTGEGGNKYCLLTVDGTERWAYFDESGLPNAAGYIRYSTYLSTPSAEKYDSQSAVGISSVGKTGNTGPATNANVADCRTKSGILIFNVKASEKIYPLENWKAYLAAQKAAGTPVQVAYKLAEPVPITATGAQPLLALAGANTVLSDADSATVTGRADPIKRITDLEAAVASIN